MSERTRHDRQQWLETQLRTGGLPPAPTAEAHQADDDFCDDASVEDCCRRVVSLALRGMTEPGANVDAADLDGPGHYLARLLDLRRAFDR